MEFFSAWGQRTFESYLKSYHSFGNVVISERQTRISSGRKNRMLSECPQAECVCEDTIPLYVHTVWIMFSKIHNTHLCAAWMELRCKTFVWNLKASIVKLKWDRLWVAFLQLHKLDAWPWTKKPMYPVVESEMVSWMKSWTHHFAHNQAYYNVDHLFWASTMMLFSTMECMLKPCMRSTTTGTEEIRVCCITAF